MDGSINHLEFFKSLGELEEGSADWRATSAGLVLLRLIEHCTEGGDGAPDPWNVRAVRSAIEAIPVTDSVRPILVSTLDAFELNGWRSSPILPRLMAYGRALDIGARWSLARDVYRSIIKLANPGLEADLVVDAQLRLGFCARVEGLWEESLSAFLAAGRTAEILADEVRSLRVMIARAALNRERGNYPAADQLLVTVLQRSHPDGELRGIHANALHERAVVAHARNHFEEGLQYAYAAFDLTELLSDRDRILADIATLFFELGVYSASRDAYLVVAATAQEQWSRWHATIQLMKLASIQRLEPLFQAHRRELKDAEMPPRLRVLYHLHTGRGLCLFDHVDEGRENLGMALRLAVAHQLHELAYQAQESLDISPAVPPVWHQLPVPAVDEIAARIEKLRLASVGE